MGSPQNRVACLNHDDVTPFPAITKNPGYAPMSDHTFCISLTLESKSTTQHDYSALPPPVKPSAIAMGTFFTHTASLGILAPVFGDTYHRAQSANSKEEFIKSKEAAGAAAAWGSSLVGSAVQTYGVAALINATGTLSYKGAAYLGTLIFFASSAPGFVSQIFSEKRPLDTVAVGAVSRVFETVGLSLFLTWWGTRTNPFD
ncbi:uncharacterized protein N7473_003160 [Penicillium subrubescens]|uniref:uncharacterized protein n=1 Tax=Penicillium subrubescens TaxID=1316194 RepID=UPI002544DC71|nr:uncharacterized protein N7473_003160 [Penicillium subrubescens]KAJ5906244.1 hypothetical protein N7473_003160 [Penicillium subrubescens]